MKSRKCTLILVALLVSFSVSFLYLKIVNMAFQISQQPVKSLLIRTALLAMFAIPIILKKKEMFVYYFLFSFPFMQFMNRTRTISLLTVYAVILLVAYWNEILSLIRRKLIIYKYSFLILLLCFIYTTLFAKYPLQALEKTVFYLSLGGIFFALTAYLKSEKELNTFLKIILGVYIFCCLISFWQLTFGINSIKFSFGEYNPNTNIYGFIKRIPSIFNEAQGAGQYFAVMSILSLGIFASIFKKLKLGVLTLFLGSIALILTASRLAVLSFLLGLILVIIFPFSLKKLFIIFACIFLIAGSIISNNSIMQNIMPESLRERFNRYGLTKTSQYRYKLWTRSLPIIVNNPFGVGLGGYNRFEAGYKENAYFPGIVKKTRKYTHFESSYLSLLYSLGIIGFSSFIYLIIKYFLTGYDLLKKRKNVLSLYLMSSMLIWLITASTSPQIEQVQSMIIFIQLLVLMNTLKNFSLPINNGKNENLNH